MRRPGGLLRSTQYGIRRGHSVLRKPYSVSRSGFALVCLALVLATAWAPAPQQDELAVVGQVTNGSAGGSVPEGLEVTLHVFAGMDEVDAYTAALSPDGSFRFEDVAPEVGESFMAEVVYQDVAYGSGLVTLEAGRDELSLPVTIYEVTDDPDAVLVTQMHIFMSKIDDRLQFGEYYLISNTGDRTYVGAEDPDTGRKATLPFTLPAGAEDLSFDGPGLGDRFLEREAGFVDTEPVVPGTATTEALFSYELPYQEGMQVERRFDLDVNSIVLLLAEEGMALQGGDLISAGTLTTQMGPAVSYTAGPLAAGVPLVFAVVSDPQAMMASPAQPAASVGGSSLGRSAARETSIGLVALAAAVVVAYLLWTAPGAPPLPEPARPLIESIVALDADFEAGRVSEKDYRRQRRSLEQQLRPFVRKRDA
jgi:hypothetical protein